MVRSDRRMEAAPTLRRPNVGGPSVVRSGHCPRTLEREAVWEDPPWSEQVIRLSGRIVRGSHGSMSRAPGPLEVT